MRKSIIVIIAFVCLFSGCACVPSQDAGNSSVSSAGLSEKEPQEYVITHDSVADWQKDQPSDFLQNDLVQTEECVIAIANAIVKNAVGDQEWEQLTLANVWEDDARGVWIVSYSLRSDDADTVVAGGGVNIAISRHDAQVVKMWSEE